ncbi:uncharacterized protein LOC135122194 isoform X2 [Zophobas morio]|uniref:uncharacterized protein LOC135122194 isoform X2 n=1 Tax=Zophobas morio TaxID=2755281 RepID=UPI0030827E9A
MPLRHSPSIPRLNRALFIAKSLKTLTESRNNLIQKFCKVTQRKLYELEGRLGNPEDILEFHEFPSDDQGINETALFKVIESFFCKHHVVNYKYMMVSLSGGVDSMVLTKITCVLSKKFLYRVVCLHVDYGNRVESAAEAKFVEDWCSKLGCAFHKVDCGKYTRNETPRGEYEKISRMFRYELYVKTLFYYKNDCPGIMVGHHAGDLQENVISNLMRGCSLLDLGGMASTSVVNGVTILRPMLERSKAEILDFAHTFGVPYFKDTTPKWSNRGKLRSHLLPLLQEIYGSGVTSNLSSVARDSFELNEMTRRYIFQPFWDSVCRTPLGVHVDCAPYVDLPLYFWKEALLHLCHTVLGISMISEKPIQLMMNRLKNPVVTRLINLSMKKNYFSYLWNTTFVLFNPKFTSEVHENTAGFVIRQGQTRLLGRWTVSVSPSISEGALSGVDSEIPAILDVISGRLSYFLPFAEEFIVSPIRPPKFNSVCRIIIN